MTAPPRRVDVEIGELVLHGFDHGQRDEIAAAVRTGLAAALEGWRPAAGASTTHLEAGSFTMPAAAAPAVVGQGVARQIRQALTGGLRTVAEGGGR
jgi:hypothetical protein